MWNNITSNLSSNLTAVINNKGIQGIHPAVSVLSNASAGTNSGHLSFNDTSDPATILALIRGKPVRFVGVAWKRRSGFGKFSSSSAWEMRRFELVGNILCYYEDSDTEKDSETPTRDAPLPPSTDGSPKNLMADEKTKIPVNKSNSADSNRSLPRGYLDLLKDDTSVGASSGHSAAPTPFAISIKVLGQTKWKMCFETHMDLMQWLAALTDVIVQGSVDGYNVQLLQAADPTSGGGDLGQLREPPMESKREGDSHDLGATGGHRLWTTGEYKVQNCNEEQLAELEKVIKIQEEQRTRLQEESLKQQTKQIEVEKQKMGPEQQNLRPEVGTPKKEEGDEKTKSSLGENTHGKKENRKSDKSSVAIAEEDTKAVSATPHMSTTEPAEMDSLSMPVMYGFHSDRLPFVALILNAALVGARSSFTSIETFWTLIMAVNVTLLRMLHKVSFGAPGVSTLTANKSPASGVASINASQAMSSTKNMPSLLKGEAGMEQAEMDVLDAIVDYKPHAGSTMMEVKDVSSPPTQDGQTFIGWQAPPPGSIVVRSHGYSKTKKKVPSPGELYKLVCADFFESTQRCPDMASRVVLPKVDFKDDGPKTWNAPDIFVVSISIPTDPPSLTSTSTDGGGFVVTMYFVMHEDTREILRRVTADGYDPSQEELTEDGDGIQKSKANAARLFDDWCRRAPSDNSYMARFKVVPDAQNLQEIGVPSWISKYNAKPFLIKRPGQTGFLYRHPEQSCMEFDISLHPFPYIAKKGIVFMKDVYFKSVIVTFAFVIESRSDDELPECVLGLMTLCYPDPEHAIQHADLFSGKSRRSFDEPRREVTG